MHVPFSSDIHPAFELSKLRAEKGERREELSRADLSFLPSCSILLCSVFVRVSSTIVKPRQDRPYEGMISLNFELSPMASTSYETGR